jgi:acyl carrier protein
MKFGVVDIRNACVDSLAAILQVAKSKIDTRVAFDRLGLDSVLAVSLLVDLERRFDLELSPDAVFEYQTIDELSEYIVAVSGEGGSGDARSQAV